MKKKEIRFSKSFKKRQFENTEFTGKWIPKGLLYLDEITPSERDLLILIKDYCMNGGFYYGMNKSLGAHLGVSEARISQMLSKLHKLKLIYSEQIKKTFDEGGALTERRIYITNITKCLIDEFMLVEMTLIDLIETLIDLSGDLIDYEHNTIRLILLNQDSISKEIVSNSGEFDNVINNQVLSEDEKSSPKKQNKTSPIKKNKEIPPGNTNDKFVEFWNSMPNLRTHNRSSAAWQKSLSYIRRLLHGNFGRFYPVSPEYLEMNKVEPERINQPFTEDEIYEAIKRFDHMCSSEYVNFNKAKFPKNMSDFFYNGIKNTSFFMTLAGPGREPKPFCEKVLDEEILKLYQNELGLKKLNDAQYAELVRCVNFVVKQNREYLKNVERVPYDFRGKSFYRTHISFVRERYQDAGKFTISVIGNTNNWKKYIDWAKQNMGKSYDLMAGKIKNLRLVENMCGG